MTDVKKTSRKASAKDVKKVLFNEDKRLLSKLLSTQSFDFFIMSIILADAIVLGLMTSDVMNMYFYKGLFLLDRLFMGIFIVEMFLKLYAFRKSFFKSGWNVFDLVVVTVSSFPATSAFIILRTFRLFRLFKYIHKFSRANNVVTVFIDLLPIFVSFLGVFLVFFYVFSIIAVSMFGDVFISFESLGRAMFTLLQVFTLDGWASTIARPVMEVFPNAWVFFVVLVLVSFLLVISFINCTLVQILKSNEKSK